MRLCSLGTFSSLAITLFTSGCRGSEERAEGFPPSSSFIDAAVVERENLNPGIEPLRTHAVRAPLSLSEKGAKVTIPIGALPAGVDVTLTRTPVGMSGFQPDDAEEPITEVYALKFSKAVRSRKLMQLGIEIPQEVAKGFYGYVKLTGARPFGEFNGSSDWSLEAGRFDPKNRILYFPISAPAEEISVVVVKRGKR